MRNRALPPRRSTQVRRTPIRRAGPRIRTVQVLAALLTVACAVGLMAVSAAPAFDARILKIHGATFTSEKVIRSIVGMDASPNLFRIHTDRAAEQLVRLPAVESASVEVVLPSTVVVNIVEREPKLIWAIGEHRYAVDQDGLLFGLVDSAGNPIPSSAGPLVSPSPGASTGASGSPAPSDSAGPPASAEPVPSASPQLTPSPTPKPTAKPTPTPKPGKATAKPSPTKAGAKASTAPSAGPSATPVSSVGASLVPSLAPAPTPDPAASPGLGILGLPVVFDRRSVDAGLGLGSYIDPINLDAGYRLSGLTPADAGSTASSLAVVLDDTHGFTVSSVPAGWVAEFGFYAATVRKVTVIPSQVRDLRSLLLQYGDAHVAWVWLVADVADNKVNTYLPR